MDHQLLSLLHGAIVRIGPRLAADPAELLARKARRRKSFFQRPPRPWCLALRANDTRLSSLPTSDLFLSFRAFVPFPSASSSPAPSPSTFSLTASALRRLCLPVRIDPGTHHRDVAAALGMSSRILWAAARRGQFAIRHIPHLRGSRRPVPILSSPSPLDPAGLWRNAADPAYATAWRYLADHIPADFSQTLIRISTYRPYRGASRFAGHAFLCPACHRPARILYCPLPGLLADFVEPEPPDSPDAIPQPISTFACAACHRVQDYGRTDDGWNHLIAYLSGGLLYGREVSKPSWWHPTRKRACKPRPSRPLSPRTQQLFHLLIHTNLKYRQIAQRLDTSTGSICGLASMLYRRHGVSNRAALRQLLLTPSIAQPHVA